MITLEEILVLSLLVYGIVSLVLIGEYKNKISELENTHKK
ncbi:MAG: hypothetical protein ACI9SI_000055 [Polaribacter sp.]|jgi:hypothetical protein